MRLYLDRAPWCMIRAKRGLNEDLSLRRTTLALPTQRRVLRLFLASPNDVARERSAVSDEVICINRDFPQHTDYTIDLLAWENTLPGAGRPQAQINAAVDRCDLFVGVLWKRWGSPAGNLQTGFEEEFHRAKDRRDSTGQPDIWIYFRDVSTEEREDPGPQLQQVLAFRSQLEIEQQILYRTFSDHAQFSAMLNNHLLRHLLTLKEATPETALSSTSGSANLHSLPPSTPSPANSGSVDSLARSMLDAVSNRPDLDHEDIAGFEACDRCPAISSCIGHSGF